MSVNLLLLPELLEMIDSNDRQAMRTFCTALHPASIAEYLEELPPEKIWIILKANTLDIRAALFSYFHRDLQIQMIEGCPRHEIARLLEETPSDDRVDLLDQIDPEIAEELKQLLSKEDQRDVELLSRYPDDTCGAEMSSDFVRLQETMTVEQALAEIGAQTHLMETVYYLYALDKDGRLAGVVSARELLRRMNQPNEPISSFMRKADTLVTVDANMKRSEAVKLVEKYDFIAIPVISELTRKMLGVITHDDVLDMAVEELVENAHLSAGVGPLEHETYLGANVFTLAKKRFTWLAILLFSAITTALTLKLFSSTSAQIAWLVAFLPMIVSTGGNSGGQSATLVITALATGEVTLADWRRIFLRETHMGLILGVAMGGCGLLNALFLYGWSVPFLHLLLVPLAVFFVVFSSNMTGALLPLLFQKLNLDPALMSNPFVAGISDTVGTFIYMLLAQVLLIPFYS
ncbi:MAG: magnesium transporter [Thermoguttaceae bacterium]|jgi:magnesium transporter